MAINSGVGFTSVIAGAYCMDGGNFQFGTASGTKIGTATDQLLGFWNATPVDQPANTSDLKDALIELGLRATGGVSPLNLDGGTLTAGLGVFAPAAAATGVPCALTVTAAANTGLTASTAAPDVLFDLSADKTWATGAIAWTADVEVKARVYKAAAASTIAIGATVQIDNSPTASTNVTLTRAWGLRVIATAVGTSAVGGIVVDNTTPATADNQKYSPLVCQVAHGWETTGGTSQDARFATQVRPVQGTALAAVWDLKAGINLGAYFTVLSVASGGNVTFVDGATLNFGSTTGVKVGATSDKIGFLGATPVVQQAATADLKDTLVAFGFIADSGATPLNLDGGALTIESETITQVARTSGVPTALTITGAAHTTMTTTAEDTDVYLDLSGTKQWAQGAITTQRDVHIAPRTYAFATGASTVTTATTVAISGAPRCGTNAVITTPSALSVGGASTQVTASGLNYAALRVPAHTVTVTGTTQVTAAPGAAAVAIGQVTITNAGTSTMDTAASLYIANAPVAAGTLTLTAPYALWVDAGTTRLDGAVALGAGLTMPATGNLVIGGTNAGATAAGVLALCNGVTAPTGSANLVHLYAEDDTGSAVLAIYAETAVATSVGTASTHSIPIHYNGTLYHVLVSNV